MTARNREHSIPHILRWLDKAGWIGNFDAAAAGALPDARRGREFSDSEVYKSLEAVAWELAVSAEPTLAVAYDDLVERVAAAQEPDGYLNTNFGRPGQAPRYSDLEWGHELYCFGHLFQAAVARLRTGARRPARRRRQVGRRPRVRRVRARRSRGRLRSPGDRDGPGRVRPGDRRAALPRAGRRCSSSVAADAPWPTSSGVAPTSRTTCPFRRPTSLRGHAVRALYLAAGAVDVAVETGDDELLDALPSGSGSTRRAAHVHHRWPWVAPSGRGVRRRLVAAPRPRLLRDLRGHRPRSCSPGDCCSPPAIRPTPTSIERTLYNVVATSPDTDGRRSSTRTRCTSGSPGIPPDPDAIVPARLQLDACAVVRGLLLPAQRRPHVRQPRRLPRDEGRVRNPAAAVRRQPHLHHPDRRAPTPARGRDRLSPRRFRPDQVRRPSGRPMDPDPPRPRMGAGRHDHRPHRNPVCGARQRGDHRRVPPGTTVVLDLP